jgi:putative hemolysin
MCIIDKSTEDRQTFSQRIPLAALAEVPADGKIETICRQLAHVWRERRLPPAIQASSNCIAKGGRLKPVSGRSTQKFGFLKLPRDKARLIA